MSELWLLQKKYYLLTDIGCTFGIKTQTVQFVGSGSQLYEVFGQWPLLSGMLDILSSGISWTDNLVINISINYGLP